ncbi:hypothetical protein CEXT_658951, partial [Caerostris extrusa]
MVYRQDPLRGSTRTPHEENIQHSEEELLRHKTCFLTGNPMKEQKMLSTTDMLTKVSVDS